MLCAIYARKSTEQNGADADAKSAARQVEGGCAFAESKGWHVTDEYMFADDAVSGAETKKLVNRQRLLDMIEQDLRDGVREGLPEKRRAPCQYLVQHAAERPNVRAPIQKLAPCLLR